MGTTRIAGIGLIIAGVLGLVFSTFSFTKETHDLSVGPIDLSVQEKQQVNVPGWAAAGAIVVGGVMLVLGGGKR